MLEAYSSLDPANARSEMKRFLGWPGQAISYKIGEQEILRLREDLQQRQGRDFSAKTFHARLLELGAIDIALLRQFLLED